MNGLGGVGGTGKENDRPSFGDVEEEQFPPSVKIISQRHQIQRHRYTQVDNDLNEIACDTE